MNLSRFSRFRFLWLFAVCLLSVALLSGCSSFRHEWGAAAMIAAPADDITGRWEGQWRSDKNGHHGRLRCIVTKESEAEYTAHFHAVYWKILRASYVVNLKGQRTNEVVHLRGEANLGKLGGTYEYKGTATATRFESTYRSRYDYGTFKMERVPHEAVFKSK